MKCTKCGAELSDDVKFCNVCGESTNVEVEEDNNEEESFKEKVVVKEEDKEEEEKEEVVEAPKANKSVVPLVLLTIIATLLVITIGGGVYLGRVLLRDKNEAKKCEPPVSKENFVRVSYSGRVFEVPKDYEYYVEDGVLVIKTGSDLEYGINGNVVAYDETAKLSPALEQKCIDAHEKCLLREEVDKYFFVEYNVEKGENIFKKLDGYVKSVNGDGFFTQILSKDMVSKNEFDTLVELVGSSKYVKGVARGMEEEEETSFDYSDYVDLSDYGNTSNEVIEPVLGE